MPIDMSYRQAATGARHARADSPVLERLRKDNTVWSGVVYWSPVPAETDPKDIERELKTIRDCGFQCVRFHHLEPRYLGDGRWDHSTGETWMRAAERVGMPVIVCGEVYTHPPEQLLKDHGVSGTDFARSWFDQKPHRAVIADYAEAYIGHFRGKALAWCVLAEPNPSALNMANPEDRALFARWLKRAYGTLEHLNAQWRIADGQAAPVDWDCAAATADPKTAATITGVHNAKKSYGAARDYARFIADWTNARAAVIVDIVSKIDPETPVGVGSHQLFVNQPKLGWDIGQWARMGHLHTTSIHLSWHFEPVKGEVDIPVWLQARMTRDYAKGGFTSAFETTGGPVQYSGGYGNHMDEGLMRRLCLSYLAAGNQTMAFWSWNARGGGWEQGEYGMVGLSGTPMPWAYEAGRIAGAMDRWRSELWEESDTRSVGIVESWETDAILTCEPKRHGASGGIPGEIHGGVDGFHRRALIGAGRALTKRSGVTRSSICCSIRA